MNEAPRSNLVEVTVSELSAALKRTVEDAYSFVRVRGEISGYRGRHSSGHAYFSLKDEGAKPKRKDMYSLTVIGYMGNNVLPARAGDAIRVFLAAPRAETSKRTVVGTLVAERLLDVAVLLVHHSRKNGRGPQGYALTRLG